MGSSAPAKRAFGWLLAVALGAQLLWPLQLLDEYGALIGRLWGEPLGERGFRAADEHRNLLGQAAHPRLRESLRAHGPARAGTSVAKTWRWAFDHRRDVPADARVYLNTAHLPAYLYGSFFWYPARVYVDSGQAPITNAQTLQAQVVSVPRERWHVLSDAGFSRAIVAAPDGGGVRLVGLGPGGAP